MFGLNLREGAAPYDVTMRDGNSRLLRFRTTATGAGRPILLVPSMINRWYVLDLGPGASLVAALVEAGHDVWCLDWGVPGDEDRHLDWEAVTARLQRTVRFVRRRTGGDPVGLLGYCMGGTLAAIHTALHPEDVAGLVNLAGPIDFAKAGVLAHFVDPQWFDAEAIVQAGNLSPKQMQDGFTAISPSKQIAKWIMLADRVISATDADARTKGIGSFARLNGWASDNIPFPAAAYTTWIRDLYQRNDLAQRRHHVGGRRVELGQIGCPVLVISAANDAICPPESATALLDQVASTDKRHVQVPGGHVGAVVGRRAAKLLYPAISAFFEEAAPSRAPSAYLGSHDAPDPVGVPWSAAHRPSC